VIYLSIFVVVLLPMIVAVVSPAGMIYLLAFIGPLPISGNVSKEIGFLFGKIDLVSLRVLGSMIGSGIIIASYFGRSTKILNICLIHILFLFIIAISLIWTTSIMFGLRTLLKLIAPLVLLVAVGVAINDKKKINRLLVITLLSCLLSALIAVITTILGMTNDIKLTMPGMSAAVFSSNMLIGLIVALNKESNNKVLKYVYIGIFVTAILFANTRITIGAMFVIFSIYGFFRMKGILKYIIPISSMLCFLMLFLLVEKFRSRMFLGSHVVSFESVKDINNAMGRVAGSGRFAAWSEVLDKFFKPHMAFGSGIGTTQNFYYSSNLGIGVIHSEYVRLLAETGLVGLLLFMLSMFYYFLSMKRNMMRFSGMKNIYIMGICSLFSYMTFMATDNAFDYINQFGFYVFGIIGIAIARPVISSDTKT